jgi:hypothetical protein
MRMDTRDRAIFYPRLAAEPRRIEVDAMPGWVQTPRGLRPAGQVLPEVTFATALFTTVWMRVPATVCGLLALHGAGRTARCARTQVTYSRVGRR